MFASLLLLSSVSSAPVQTERATVARRLQAPEPGDFSCVEDLLSFTVLNEDLILPPCQEVSAVTIELTFSTIQVNNLADSVTFAEFFPEQCGPGVANPDLNCRPGPVKNLCPPNQVDRFGVPVVCDNSASAPREIVVRDVGYVGPVAVPESIISMRITAPNADFPYVYGDSNDPSSAVTTVCSKATYVCR